MTLKVASGAVFSYADKQDIRQRLTTLIKTSFASTLGQENNIVSIVMALIQRESAFKTDANHMFCNTSSSSGARDYWNSNAVKLKAATADTTTYNNLQQGLRAWGIMGSMGWNSVRGGSGSGKCPFEQYRPELTGPILVNPGDSISAVLDGPNNVGNQLLAGLVMLEAKYKFVAPGLVSSGKWPDRMTASIAAYLGLGPVDTRTGITPAQYAASIMYGPTYQAANGVNGVALASYTPAQVSNGPVTTTTASGQTQYTVGCG